MFQRHVQRASAPFRHVTISIDMIRLHRHLEISCWQNRCRDSFPDQSSWLIRTWFLLHPVATFTYVALAHRISGVWIFVQDVIQSRSCGNLLQLHPQGHAVPGTITSVDSNVKSCMWQAWLVVSASQLVQVCRPPGIRRIQREVATAHRHEELSVKHASDLWDAV